MASRVLLLVVAVLAFAASVRAADESDVVVLNSDNFETIIEHTELLLVEFYAPWCGHCKSLAPKWEAAATQLKGIAPIAKIDCTAEADVCGQHEVRGYPTIKLFRNGVSSEYSGPREVDGIVRFIKKQKAPTVSELTADSFKDFTASDKVVLVAFVESKESPEFTVFRGVADRLHNDYTFGVTTDAAIATANGVSAPAIILFKTFDEGKNIFEGSFDAPALDLFIKTNAVPTMADIGPDNYASYAESGLPLAYLFIGTPEQRHDLGPLLEVVAKELKGKVNFVYIDGNKYGGHAGNLNLKQEWPAFAVQLPQQNLKFPFDQNEEITTESIRTFVQDILDGKLNPSLKSEEIPEENAGPVVVVVGKQYQEIVNQPKDVLIEFYAPWCGHCKKLAPIWDELGTKLKGNENVVIAKMDATANDLPADAPFQVSGFPTIKLVKADNTVVDYNGERTLDDFIKFLKAHSSNGKNLIVGDAQHAEATKQAAKDASHGVKTEL